MSQKVNADNDTDFSIRIPKNQTNNQTNVFDCNYLGEKCWKYHEDILERKKI